MNWTIVIVFLAGVIFGLAAPAWFRRRKDSISDSGQKHDSKKPDWAAIHKELKEFIDNSDHPSELLSFEPFEKAAAFLAGSETSTRELTQFWYGSRYTLAAAALHAAFRRNDPPEIYEELAGRTQDIVATPLFFALKLLDQKGPPKLVPRVLCQIQEWWSDHAMYSRIISDFVEGRLAKGETLASEPAPASFKKERLPEMRLIAEKFE